jgi:copper chaperone NosL
MTIVDRQHAAQAVTNKGRVYKFDAIECLLNYVEDEGGEEQFAHLLVNDFQQPGVLIPAQESQYLISKAVPSPMGAYLSAFEHAEAADQMQAEKGGHVYHWKALQHHAELSGLVTE